MRKKPEIHDTDKAIFREAMRHVKPLTHTKIQSSSPSPQRPTLKKEKEHKKMDTPFSDYDKLEPVSSEDLLAFNRPGIQHKILRKLRGGQYNVEAVLDLHGMTVEKASIALHQFLLHCQERAVRHVLIIHGKGTSSGKPILKNKLNHWLRQTEHVLAFCSATAKDGRGGALYALLKKRGS